MSATAEETEEFISLYEGSGKLNQQDCEFEVGQRSDGQIRVYCTFSDSPELVNAHGVKFCGCTNDGRKVLGKGPFQNRPWGVDYDTEPERYFSHYGLWELTVGEQDWSKAHSVSFALTNFLFCGNDANSGGRGTCYNKFKLKLDSSDVVFRRVDDYYDIYNTVVTGQSTEVTCELTIAVDGRGRDEVRKMINRICDLLTIAQGRRIEWINYRVYDANSSLIFTYHEIRRTDPRRGFVLIDFQNANTAINYLTKSFPAYGRFDSQHPSLLNGVANIMFDTNAARFTITHALSMFCMVDALGKNLLDYQYISRGKTPPHRYPIKTKVEALKNAYKVCLCQNEIDYFGLSRNCVVHELKFHTGDARKEYEKSSHIFHRILLRILDYEHLYFDITLPTGQGFGEDMLHSCP
ncbi:MAG: hypothetical protein OXI77_18320 [Chloroflexota bacterium]|nr:hypothetical protein [Chloroflexota bacterium]MDE2909020.1 hypothetical protein [Chloroflexota bacterium]